MFSLIKLKSTAYKISHIGALALLNVYSFQWLRRTVVYVLLSSEKEGDNSKRDLKTKLRELFSRPEENQSDWNRIFLTSYVIAVIIDPLFFYVPIINEDRTCLGMDQKLRIGALVLRTVTDLFYILHIVFRVYIFTETTSKSNEVDSGGNETLDKHASRESILRSFKHFLEKKHIIIAILSILPVPQVRAVFRSLDYFSFFFN